MAAGLTFVPFAYRPGATVIHRAPAGLKFVCVIALSALCFSSIHGFVASSLLVIVAAAAARVPPRDLLKGARPLVVLAVFIVLVKTIQPGAPGIVAFDMQIPFIDPAGFSGGLLAAVRLFVPFAAAALLFAVTTMRELRHSLAVVELRLKEIFFPGSKNNPGIAFFSLGISLMLGFIPRFFDLWEASNHACEARSCRRGLRRLLVLIPLVTERMMEAAADTALALQARGLGQNNTKQ